MANRHYSDSNYSRSYSRDTDSRQYPSGHSGTRRSDYYRYQDDRDTSGRQYSSGRSGTNRNGYNRYQDDGDVDRYHYVDRDIYSNSAPERRHGSRPPKKKGGCAKKVFSTLLVLVLIALGGGYIYFHVLASRLNRSDNVNSSTLQRYVQQPAAAPAWDVANDGNVMNILLLGVDENKDGSDGRSDSNMLASIDKKSKKIRLVSFLRDSYLQIPTVGKDKLNAAYANGGVALTMQTLENNYRVNIDKYVSTNFNNFATVVDKMGGLDVPMTSAACRQENINIGTHLSAGTNHLNGKQALYYARIRNATDKFGHDDYGRASRQRQVVELMIQKIKSMNLVQSGKIMYDYLPYVKTNLTDSELACIASIGATLSQYKVETMQIPAPGTFNDQKVIDGVGKVVKIDLKANCAKLRQFLYGDVSSDN